MKNFLRQRLGSVILLFLATVFVAWGIFSINRAIANSPGRMVWDYTPPEPNVDGDAVGEYVLIAQSGFLRLFFNDTNGAIQIEDTTNGFIWESVATDEIYNIGRLNPLWAARVQSPLALSFNNMQHRDAPPAMLFSQRDMDYMEVEYLNNGVAVVYGFTAQGFFIRVEYTLEDGVFVVRVPWEGIREYSNFAVTALQILPFFGTANDFVDGYMLYPDGSGGITRFENRHTRPMIVGTGMWYPYTHRVISIDNIADSMQRLRFSAALPVLGIKYNDNAFLAAVTQGEENTGIMAYPSGQVVNLNRIHFEVYPRNLFNVEIDNISVGGVGLGRIVQRIDREIIREDREIKYFMLSGADATYSGMASVYREYLINTGQLTNSISEGEDVPLSIMFHMGAAERQMVFDTFHSMTTFTDVSEILERLKTSGVNNINAVLTSWTRSGYSPPRNWPPARQIGGTNGLSELNRYLANNPGFNVFLESNYVYAIRNNGGFSAMNDVVYNGTSIPVSSQYFVRGGSTELYLLNPEAARSRNDQFLNRLRPYENIHVSFREIGRVVYNDYNRRASFTKSETVDVWRGMLNESAGETGRVAARGFNQYTFQSADFLYDVPMRSFGLNITDDHVPFVQMVLSGKIPFTGEPGNLSYDLNRQVLKWIEFGAVPTFTITYNDPIILRNTAYNYLFTSAFNSWEERILDIYEIFRTDLADIYGKQMVSHEILKRDVVRVEYENGVTIYINYTNDEVLVGDVLIPPVDYVVVR